MRWLHAFGKRRLIDQQVVGANARRSDAIPIPVEALPCGSRSISSTFQPVAAMAVAMLIAVVVLPTPPFWLAIATQITTFSLPSGAKCADDDAGIGDRSAIVPRGTDVPAVQFVQFLLRRTPLRQQPDRVACGKSCGQFEQAEASGAKARAEMNANLAVGPKFKTRRSLPAFQSPSDSHARSSHSTRRARDSTISTSHSGRSGNHQSGESPPRCQDRARATMFHVEHGAGAALNRRCAGARPQPRLAAEPGSGGAFSSPAATSRSSRSSPRRPIRAGGDFQPGPRLAFIQAIMPPPPRMDQQRRQRRRRDPGDPARSCQRRGRAAVSRSTISRDSPGIAA
jgi:hypothetical protein